MSRGWLSLCSFLTYITIAVVGQVFIRDEPFRTLWVFISGFLALLIWYPLGRYVNKRKNRRDQNPGAG